MKTKEEILDTYKGSIEYPQLITRSEAEDAMKEYADQFIKPTVLPESKEVESVAVKSATQILAEGQCISMINRRFLLFSATTEKVIGCMEEYASQFKQPANNEAVKVIEESLGFHKKLKPSASTKAIIHTLTHILKLIQ